MQSNDYYGNQIVSSIKYYANFKVFKNLISRLYMTFSKNLEKAVRIDVGL